MTEKDLIFHPSHYVDVAGKLEPIDFCRLFPFCFGNYCKYVLRAGHKGDKLTDLKKALVYLRWAQEELMYNEQFKQSLLKYRHLAHCFNNEYLSRLFFGIEKTIGVNLAFSDEIIELSSDIDDLQDEKNNISSNQ